MWRSETLAIVVSSTSMKVASDTTTAISQGLGFPAAERGSDAEAMGLLQRDGRLDRHPRPDRVAAQLVGAVEGDLHRHALRHLHVVAGRVLRRQQAEVRAGRALDAVDLARE